MQNIKVKRGDSISLKGKRYRLNKTISLSVTAERRSDQLAAPPKEVLPPLAPPNLDVQGERKSDPAQGISKAAVLELIQEKIKVLEKHEDKLLMEGLFDDLDDLEFVDQQRGEHYKTATYAATTVHIMDLKSLYNKVKNLS